MNRRWVCPNGCGNNILAPGRMRTDDVRRYCLDCSKKSGRLVARVCPALEKKRTDAKARRREKAAADRAMAAEARRLEDGTNVDALLRKARRLKAWGRQSFSCARAVRRVKTDILIGQPSSSHGRAWSYRIHIHLRKDETRHGALLLTIHELAHVASDAERGGGYGHDRWFWTLWLDAVQEVYPLLKNKEQEIWAKLPDATRDLSEIGLGHYALEWRVVAPMVDALYGGIDASWLDR